MNRYTTNGEEGEILPNLLGITDEETLHNAEFEGFLMAEILFTGKLTPKTKFSVKYICDIHRTALKELSPLPGVSVPSTFPKADSCSRPEDLSRIVCAFSKKKFFPNSLITTPVNKL
mgnify:CR=1 FL=1